jgi:hypothetical protein
MSALEVAYVVLVGYEVFLMVLGLGTLVSGPNITGHTWSFPLPSRHHPLVLSINTNVTCVRALNCLLHNLVRGVDAKGSILYHAFGPASPQTKLHVDNPDMAMSFSWGVVKGEV